MTAPTAPDRRRRRAPKTARSEQQLHEKALWYLERFSATEKKMRDHLGKKIRESVAQEVATSAEAHAWLEAVISRLLRVGLLDDKRYAEQRAGQLNRRGKSLRAIQYDLRGRGIASEHVDAALEALREEHPDPEWAAAVRLAQRRRLGPWYGGEDRKERRQKHLGALARQGFSFDLARRIIDAESPEALLDRADE